MYDIVKSTYQYRFPGYSKLLEQLQHCQHVVSKYVALQATTYKMHPLRSFVFAVMVLLTGLLNFISQKLNFYKQRYQNQGKFQKMPKLCPKCIIIWPVSQWPRTRRRFLLFLHCLRRVLLYLGLSRSAHSHVCNLFGPVSKENHNWNTCSIGPSHFSPYSAFENILSLTP